MIALLKFLGRLVLVCYYFGFPVHPLIDFVLRDDAADVLNIDAYEMSLNGLINLNVCMMHTSKQWVQ